MVIDLQCHPSLVELVEDTNPDDMVKNLKVKSLMCSPDGIASKCLHIFVHCMYPFCQGYIECEAPSKDLNHFDVWLNIELEEDGNSRYAITTDHCWYGHLIFFFHDSLFFTLMFLQQEACRYGQFPTKRSSVEEHRVGVWGGGLYWP